MGCCCKWGYDTCKGPIGFIGYMLMVSHFAMAVQAVLYAPFYRIKMAFCGSSYMDIT